MDPAHKLWPCGVFNWQTMPKLQHICFSRERGKVLVGTPEISLFRQRTGDPRAPGEVLSLLSLVSDRL